MEQIEKLIENTFGIKCLITKEYRNYLKTWSDWYKGKVKSFHDVSTFDEFDSEIMQMGFAKTIAEARADLLFNERVKINVPEKYQKRWREIINKNNFWSMANGSVEVATALGMYAWILFEDKGDIVIDYIQPNMIYPLSYNNDEITECVFASLFTKKGKSYIYLNAHLFDNGRYIIKNKYFEWSNESQMAGLEIPAENFGVMSEIQSGVIPRFFIIKPNIKNNLIENCPMGISRYAGCIPQFKTLDIIYDSLDKEFILGRKRIMVGAETLGYDGEKAIPMFNLRQRIYNTFSISDTNTLVKEIDMSLRTEEHEAGLRILLNLISIKTGFGADYFSWDKDSGRVKTATEVISEDSDLFRSIQKDRIVLERALLDLIAAIFEIEGWVANEEEITIEWDDSIIQDEEARLNRLLVEVNSQIRTPVSYLMEAYNMTEEEALKIVPDNEIETFNREMEFLRNGGNGNGDDEK